MTTTPPPSVPFGEAPRESGAGGDPLFQGAEPVERATPRAALLFQFFLFPLMIVVASVGVALLFGTCSASEKSAAEWLDAVATGGESERKQAAHQLGTMLLEERRRVERKEIPLERAFYVADDGFRRRLGQAFKASASDTTPELQVFLAASLGLAGDPEYLPLLVERSNPSSPVELRRAVAQALGGLRTDAVVASLAERLKDPDEPVRNLAVQGLSLHRTPQALAALKIALADDSVFVRSGAAAALALFGDPAGRDGVANLLDPAWVDAAVSAPSPAGGGGTPPAGQRQAVRAAALMNGIRGAFHLKDATLRPKVEALLSDGDADVRRLARDTLDQWPDGR